MIESDRFHENYRASLVPELKILREIGHEFGAYGTYLSGAGPTVMLLLPDDKLNLLTEKKLMSKIYLVNFIPWKLTVMDYK